MRFKKVPITEAPCTRANKKTLAYTSWKTTHHGYHDALGKAFLRNEPGSPPTILLSASVERERQ